ncbi:MAG: CoA-binding protein [Actinocatenispora sp.]
MSTYRDPAVIERVLGQRTWAVVGLTDHPYRTAYRIAQFLLDRGKHVIPVNPMGESVLGRPAAKSLADIDEPIDVVDVFRRSDKAGQHVDEAIAVNAGAVWLQLGVIDEAAADRAAAAGLSVVMDACPAIEWR